MIQRYLGNKTSLADEIIKEVNKLCQKGDYVCDIFSGTLSVSMSLKLHGYKVISNDINRFSYCYGQSHLIASSIPRINFKQLGVNEKNYKDYAVEQVETLNHNSTGFHFLKNQTEKSNYIELVTLLRYLDSLTNEDIDGDYRASYFFDYYTEKGKYSKFISQRGSEGRRKFFSPENGTKIDLYLNKLREWYEKSLMDDDLYYLLLCIIADSVEKVSNTQGTFHDFPREQYDSRALQSLKLRLPQFDNILSGIGGHILGKEMDSLEYIKEVPKHKVLYLDPPYNFRQYTSYYFMLNLICDYCEIPDLNKYFNNVKFVRGQNMEKDFSSTFCKNVEFIPSLKKLIESADSEWIIMSYFNGRNHSGKNCILNDLENFFKSDLFEEDTLRIKPIERKNYQSYGGHKASKVNELLYIVKKRG